MEIDAGRANSEGPTRSKTDLRAPKWLVRVVQALAPPGLGSPSELDPNLLEMLRLRFEQEYSCKQIAEELGRTGLGVAVNLHRGLRKLKKLMTTPGGTR